MPQFYRESTPESTIFFLKSGAFRKAQECEGKSAYHLYQNGKHFCVTDESYFLRTKKLASHILGGLDVCAEIFFPVSFPTISFSRMVQMIGWSLESKPLVITSQQQGYRKYFVFSEVHDPNWDPLCTSLWTAGIFVDYYAAPQWDIDVTSSYEAVLQRVRQGSTLSLICDDTHAVWTILLDDQYPQITLKEKTEAFCQSISAILQIEQSVDF